MDDPAVRARLVDGHLGLVFHIAKELTASSATVTAEELLGAGTLGLIQAIDRFDPGRGVQFSSFAVPRIRGAMLDAMRADDAVPRHRRTRARRLHDAADRLASLLHRPPTHAEMARALGLDDVTLARWELSACGDVQSLHDLDNGDRPGGPRAARGGGQQRDAGEWDIETRLTVRHALSALPRSERTALELYYLCGLRMWQVGEAMDITESQVSKLCKRAVARLREVVTETAPTAGRLPGDPAADNGSRSTPIRRATRPRSWRRPSATHPV